MLTKIFAAALVIVTAQMASARPIFYCHDDRVVEYTCQGVSNPALKVTLGRTIEFVPGTRTVLETPYTVEVAGAGSKAFTVDAADVSIINMNAGEGGCDQYIKFSSKYKSVVSDVLVCTNDAY